MSHRPKGNGPHMVPEYRTYKNINFECKYFGDNFTCNYHGGKCNMNWARLNCKFYEGYRPKLKKPTNVKVITKSKRNGVSTIKVGQEIQNMSKAQIPPKKPKVKIVKNSVLPNIGKYIIDPKRGIGLIVKADMQYYYVDFNDNKNKIKVKYTFDKIKEVFDTHYDAKQILGTKASELKLKVSDIIEIQNKHFKIKTITNTNIILSDGTVLPLESTRFTLLYKIKNNCAYRKK